MMISLMKLSLLMKTFRSAESFQNSQHSRASLILLYQKFINYLNSYMSHQSFHTSQHFFLLSISSILNLLDCSTYVFLSRLLCRETDKKSTYSIFRLKNAANASRIQ